MTDAELRQEIGRLQRRYDAPSQNRLGELRAQLDALLDERRDATRDREKEARQARALQRWLDAAIGRADVQRERSRFD